MSCVGPSSHFTKTDQSGACSCHIHVIFSSFCFTVISCRRRHTAAVFLHILYSSAFFKALNWSERKWNRIIYQIFIFYTRWCTTYQRWLFRACVKGTVYTEGIRSFRNNNKNTLEYKNIKHRKSNILKNAASKAFMSCTDTSVISQNQTKNISSVIHWWL